MLCHITHTERAMTKTKVTRRSLAVTHRKEGYVALIAEANIAPKADLCGLGDAN